MEDLIKKAEKNLVNICKAFDDMMNIIDAMATFGNKYCHDYIGKNEFLDGLQMMRKAIYREHAEAIRKCFLFVGVGGETAAEYSREKFKEIFCGKERYMIVHFLDKYGRIPSSYEAGIDEEFRKQARKICDE